MTIFSKHFLGHGPFGPPWLRLWFGKNKSKADGWLTHIKDHFICVTSSSLENVIKPRKPLYITPLFATVIKNQLVNSSGAELKARNLIYSKLQSTIIKVQSNVKAFAQSLCPLQITHCSCLGMSLSFPGCGSHLPPTTDVTIATDAFAGMLLVSAAALLHWSATFFAPIPKPSTLAEPSVSFPESEQAAISLRFITWSYCLSGLL